MNWENWAEVDGRHFDGLDEEQEAEIQSMADEEAKADWEQRVEHEMKEEFLDGKSKEAEQESDQHNKAVVNTEMFPEPIRKALAEPKQDNFITARIYDNMQIESMSKIELLHKYTFFKRAVDEIERNMELMKMKLKEHLTNDGEEKFTSPDGEVSIVNSKRKQFQQSVAKGFLTPEQIEQCYTEKKLSFVKILTTEAKENMRY